MEYKDKQILMKLASIIKKQNNTIRKLAQELSNKENPEESLKNELLQSFPQIVVNSFRLNVEGAYNNDYKNASVILFVSGTVPDDRKLSTFLVQQMMLRGFKPTSIVSNGKKLYPH